MKSKQKEDVSVEMDTFQNFLRDELKNSPRGERTESRQLLLWALENMYDFDREYAQTLICDGEFDKGIDALYVDDQEEVILVFQSKFKQNNDRTFGDRVLRDFMGLQPWFENQRSIEELGNGTTNRDLKNLLKEFNVSEKVEDYDVEYHFVSNSCIDVEGNLYVANISNIFVCDLTEMKKRYALTKEDDLVNHTLEFNISNLNNIMSVEIDLERRVNSAFAIITAKQLLNLNGLDDLTLFSKNVRFGLGRTRVNKSIEETIQTEQEKKNFLLYHNGISIVSEEVELDESTASITIKNYSVVNGAQSVLTFKKMEDQLTDDIKVLVKFTQVGDDRLLTELISKYNNNQNAISMKDIRSRDKIQKRIYREFEQLNSQYELNIFYKIKNGEPIPEGSIVIDNGYAGQLISACYLNAPYNTHLKSSFFDSRYASVFNRNITAFKILKYYDLHQALLDQIEKIDHKGMAEYGLTQFAIISMVSEIYKKNKKIIELWDNQQNYLDNRDNWKQFNFDVIELLIRVFDYTVGEIQKDSEEFVYKNFFKTKDTVENLTRQCIYGYDAQLKIAKQDLVEQFEKIFNEK